MSLSFTLALATCGGGGDGGGTGGTGGGGGGNGGGTGGGTTTPNGPAAHGLFEIHYIDVDPTHTYVGGAMNDGPDVSLVIWDKGVTQGDCSIYTPRVPFCESCPAGQACVDQGVCRAAPTGHSVGDVTISGLNAPSGASPLALVLPAGLTTYSAETLPLPPCTAGAPIQLDASGAGDYPAFSIQAQCIAQIEVTNPSVSIESGKAFTLTWTPGSVANARISLVFDLTHHGGSKAKLICDAADTGSLVVPGALVKSLMDYGVTGWPKAYVARTLTGKAAVGSGQAQLKVYSDTEFVVQVPNLVSCNTDADCLGAGETCQNPGMMCGISCTKDSDCPTGKVCQTAIGVCR